MNEALKTRLSVVDGFMEKNAYQEAVAELRALAEEYPEEGIVAYYLGRICLLANDGFLGLKYFLKAIELGHATADVYLSTAMLQKNLVELSDAEKSFLKAVEVSDSEDLKWATLSALAVFYIENEMYLKADKAAKKIMREFPDNYQGYHLHILVEAMREHYEEAFAYMDMVPEKFKNHPQYLLDIVEIYKKAGKDTELAELFETDMRFSAMIPQVVLREKITAMPNVENDDTKENLIRQLAREFHDKSAVVSVMILEFSRKNFKKSAEICNVILENEKENQGFNYYLALYFQMFNFYYMAEKKPSEKLRNWIEKAGNWCMNFAAEMEIPAASDMVNASIQELFDEINSAGSES